MTVVKSNMTSGLTFALAQLAKHGRSLRAVLRTVTSLVADTALAGELALDGRVGAVGLVVALLAAVEASTRTIVLVAITREVTLLAAAGKNKSRALFR